MEARKRENAGCGRQLRLCGCALPLVSPLAPLVRPLPPTTITHPCVSSLLPPDRRPHPLAPPAGRWQQASKDPVHDFVEGLATKLTANCGTDLAVFVELDRFFANLDSFDRAVFVEPLVLYGDAELQVCTSWMRGRGTHHATYSICKRLRVAACSCARAASANGSRMRTALQSGRGGSATGMYAGAFMSC